MQFGVRFFRNKKECAENDDMQIVVGGGAFWEQFTITKILTAKEKNSTSTSVIAFGVHNQSKQDIVIKSFTQYDDKNVASLLYELKVFEAMRQLAAQIPHFVNFMAAYTYTDSQIASAPLDTQELVYSLTERPEVPHLHHLTVSTRVNGFSLGHILAYNQPYAVVKSLLFQLLFCLHAMSTLGFQHNDLHIGNVLVTSEINCNSAVYFIDKWKFEVPIMAKIYIYDFDLASCGTCGPNMGLEYGGFCETSGVCNQRNPRFDMFTILNYIKYEVPVKLDDRIYRIIDFALGTEPIPQRFKYRMCNIQPNDTCAAFPPEQPKSVKTPLEVLLTQFKDYMKK